MAIHWGYLVGGAALGFLGAAVLFGRATTKTIIPNAFALGQRNPQMPYATFAQRADLTAQLTADPPLVSPPPTPQAQAAPATIAAANAVSQVQGASGWAARMLVT